MKRGTAIVVSHPAGIQGAFACTLENKRERNSPAERRCSPALRATVDLWPCLERVLSHEEPLREYKLPPPPHPASTYTSTHPQNYSFSTWKMNACECSIARSSILSSDNFQHVYVRCCSWHVIGGGCEARAECVGESLLLHSAPGFTLRLCLLGPSLEFLLIVVDSPGRRIATEIARGSCVRRRCPPNASSHLSTLTQGKTGDCPVQPVLHPSIQE